MEVTGLKNGDIVRKVYPHTSTELYEIVDIVYFHDRPLSVEIRSHPKTTLYMIQNVHPGTLRLATKEEIAFPTLKNLGIL